MNDGTPVAAKGATMTKADIVERIYEKVGFSKKEASEVVESIFEAYTVARRELRDPHLLDRARLASELALLRWLMYGVRTENEDVIADGEGMMLDLEALLFDEPEPAY